MDSRPSREALNEAWKELIAEGLRRNVVVAVGNHRAFVEAAILAALPSESPSDRVPDLDSAWAEAEAALPGEWTLSVSRTAGVSSGPYVAVTDYGEPAHAYAYADTPADALRALRDALMEAHHAD